MISLQVSDLPPSTQVAIKAGEPAPFFDIILVATPTETRLDSHFDGDELDALMKTFAENLNDRIVSAIRPFLIRRAKEIRRALADAGVPELAMYRVSVCLDRNVECLIPIIRGSVCPEFQHDTAHQKILKTIETQTRRVLKEAGL
jgi:hypothetical protein